MPCLGKRIGIKSSNLLTETSALLCAAMLKMKAVSILGFLKDSGKIFRNGFISDLVPMIFLISFTYSIIHFPPNERIFPMIPQFGVVGNTKSPA